MEDKDIFKCGICEDGESENCCEKCIEDNDLQQCEQCESWVTHDECVPFTYMNQIDFALCLSCGEYGN